mgnify:FL=1
MGETIRVTAIITGVRSPYIFKKDDEGAGLDLAATASSGGGDSALQYL